MRQLFGDFCHDLGLPRIDMCREGGYAPMSVLPVHAGDAGRVMSEAMTEAQGQVFAEARTDPAAFTRLYRLHYDPIFRYCIHRVGSRAAAEDLTSSVFTKMLERFQRVTFTDERAVGSWLYAIATNLINAHYRRGRLWERFLENFRGHRPDAHWPTPEPGPLADERMAKLSAAIRGLKPRQQALITLRFFEGLDVSQISEALGGSASTVRSQISRALKKLRRRMGADWPGEVNEHV